MTRSTYGPSASRSQSPRRSMTSTMAVLEKRACHQVDSTRCHDQRSSGKGLRAGPGLQGSLRGTAQEPGCEQFEIFQSVANPDRLALLERWVDQAALGAHARLNSTRPPLLPELRLGSGER